MLEVIFLLLIPIHSFTQTISINWNQEFRKEISISCSVLDQNCLELCHGDQACIFEEKYCRDCIGTSLRMSSVLDNLGNEITNSYIKIPFSDFLPKLGKQMYISMTSNDVYNIIDAFRSIQILEKFANLCPEGSINQILFFSVEAATRRIQIPELIYCENGTENNLFKLETSGSFNINWLRQHYIFK